jgi:hypothetical protein
MSHEFDVRPPGEGKLGWESEDPFDETKSTHLWIVNRAATLARQDPTAGAALGTLIDPATGAIDKNSFYGRLCQGLYDADRAPYNDPTGIPDFSNWPDYDIAVYRSMRKYLLTLKDYSYTWKSHFYDPDSGCNWLGEKYPTALTQGSSYFHEARRAFLSGDLYAAGYHLGLSLHFLTDLTQPMHAANFTYLSSDNWGYHSGFESYVLTIQGQTPLPDKYTSSGLGYVPDPYLVHAARNAKKYVYEICDPRWTLNYQKPGHPDSDWQEAILGTVVNRVLPDAIQVTAQYLVAWMTGLLASHKRTVLFHQGFGKSGELWYSVYDGISWLKDKMVPGTRMSDSPSAIEHRGAVYCFHQGTAENGQPWYNMYDGTKWLGDQQVPGTGMSKSPSVVEFDSDLYFFHQGSGQNGELWYNILRNGEWVGDQQVPGTRMSESPSAVEYAGKLYCFHQGTGENGQLWYNIFDGTNWLGDQQVPGTRMSKSPGAIEWNGKLYCFHQGTGENGQLWYNIFDGTNWLGDQQVPGTGMSESPSAVEYAGNLLCFHQGTGQSGELWYNTLLLDATTGQPRWVGDRHVNGVGMSAAPGGLFVNMEPFD